MAESRHDSQALVQQAAGGDQAAAARLLALHRSRLRSMIALRLDRRLSARVDPSDVLQETLAEAHHKLPAYLATQPIPFYPWLRRIAWDKIVQLHRQHLWAQARTVTREEPPLLGLSDDSALDLGQRLLARSDTPIERALEEEMKTRVRSALARLEARDREVLVLRFLEQLSVEESAATLDISPEAVKSRQRRALLRFGELMGDGSSGDAR